MSTPFYVSPQQAMADRAEYARKGIARGRSVVVLQYTDGVVFVAENPSRALHKVSEIYDRIAFAAVGKYNEFENLRIGGVRYADLRGYTYDREDVTARGLANVYAQTLGTIFSSAAEKPYEVELIVAEVGGAPEEDQIYRLPHDGSIVDEHGSVAVGGNADQISSYLDQRHRDGMTLAEALKLAVESLSRDSNGGERRLTAEQLEVATLDRTRPQKRKFKRILGRQLTRLLEEGGGAGAGKPAAGADEGAGDEAAGAAAEEAGGKGTGGAKSSGGAKGAKSTKDGKDVKDSGGDGAAGEGGSEGEPLL
ncbi:putative 20S proteasome alpha subunit [Streptomyces sp. NBRC 110611]|uniref:proteasome subunit alpha n=1 Tax=Streptomyces sp. NBRC 110611 TaxID=1621259 RepID=UPI00082E6BC5|nr:proteasome subunit alpha [Streptomyces sp. NBRC 110611]GAU66218.1 putative 20S proteasome alpha subunit [Streptomyces sp. NBRC 110611]